VGKKLGDCLGVVVVIVVAHSLRVQLEVQQMLLLVCGGIWGVQ